MEPSPRALPWFLTGAVLLPMALQVCCVSIPTGARCFMGRHTCATTKSCFCSPEAMLSTGLGSSATRRSDGVGQRHRVPPDHRPPHPRCRARSVFEAVPGGTSASARHRSRSAAGAREDHRSGAEAPKRSEPWSSRNHQSFVWRGRSAARHFPEPARAFASHRTQLLACCRPGAAQPSRDPGGAG